MSIVIKRAYEAASKSDGFRILIDRLWPRGVSREHAALDLWAKSTAPSTVLRKWFDHDPEKWPEFQKRYEAELRSNPAFSELKQIVRGHKIVTLVYGAKDALHNDAVVLQRLLSQDY